MHGALWEVAYKWGHWHCRRSSWIGKRIRSKFGQKLGLMDWMTGFGSRTDQTVLEGPSFASLRVVPYQTNTGTVRVDRATNSRNRPV